MSRYIDADALRKTLNEQDMLETYNDFVNVNNAINDTPEVDVVPKADITKELLDEIERRLPTDKTFNSSDIQIGYAWAMSSVMRMLNEIRAERLPSDETM